MAAALAEDGFHTGLELIQHLYRHESLHRAGETAAVDADSALIAQQMLGGCDGHAHFLMLLVACGDDVLQILPAAAAGLVHKAEEGVEVAIVDCRWMIVDTEAGRILRTPGWTMPDFQNDDLPEELPQIVHKSQPLTAAGERRASYSMCDLNGHINNSLYLDIACDALPQEVVEAAPLSFASIKYHREVPMGQSVQVFYAPSGNGWYLLGRREEHAAFECYLEFGSSVTESLQK